MMANILVGTDLRGSFLEAGETTWSGLLRSHAIFLPLRTAINAGNTAAVLALSPLFEANLVEILATGCLTPDELLIRFHIEDADWAFTFNRLAGTVVNRFDRVVMLVLVVGSAGDRGIGENKLELVRQEGQLVLEMDWGFEDDNECI